MLAVLLLVVLFMNLLKKIIRKFFLDTFDKKSETIINNLLYRLYYTYVYAKMRKGETYGYTS